MLQFSIKSDKKSQYAEEYVPEPYQADIHNSTARYNIMIGAPGIGKTIVGVQECLKHVLERRGNGLIAVPNFRHWADTVALEMGRWFPTNIKIPGTVSPQRIDIGDNRYIFVRSSEHPDGFHGLNDITFVWIDEPEDMPPRRHILDLCIQRVNRPRTGRCADEKDRYIITGVAEIKHGISWVLEKLVKPAQEGAPDYYFRRAPLSETTRMSKERKALIYSENPPGTWAYDKLEAIYRPDPEGMIYPELPNIGQPFKAYDLIDSDEIGFGADISRGRDPFVFGIFGRKNNIWTLFYEYRARGENEKNMAQNIRALLLKAGLLESSRWKESLKNNRVDFFHDHDGGIQMGNLKWELELLGVCLNFKPAYKGAGSVDISINFIRDKMIKKELQINTEAQDTYYEFASYKWRSSPGARDPEHEFSHGPDMVRYFLWSNALELGAANLYR